MLTRGRGGYSVRYGGPAQPNITDPRGQVQKCKIMGEESDKIYNPGQYENTHV